MSLKGWSCAIVGAGIGGLACARALCLRGADVTVFEQAPAIAEVGAGIQISPNGGRVLNALSLDDAVQRASDASEAVVLRDFAHGSPVLRMSLEGHGRFALIHRADLIALLADGAADAGALVRTGARVSDISSDGILRVAEERHQFDVIVGADGLHSLARSSVLSPTAPFFTGQVAWRATVPIVQGAVPTEAQVFLGPGRHVVAYPLRGGTSLNLVAVEERTAWAEEGWSHPGDPADLRRAFSAFGPPVSEWLAAVGEVFVWGLHRHPVASDWHKGRIVLLGDAAHPTLPFLAQGACMALEDVWALASSLDLAGSTEVSALGKALDAYQSKRRDRVARVVDAATANARNYHLRPGPIRTLAHLGLRTVNRVAPSQMLRRFDWLYGYDVTT